MQELQPLRKYSVNRSKNGSRDRKVKSENGLGEKNSKNLLSVSW